MEISVVAIKGLPVLIHMLWLYLHPGLHSSCRPSLGPRQPKCCIYYLAPKHLFVLCWQKVVL